jgi:hypothetical protein
MPPSFLSDRMCKEGVLHLGFEVLTAVVMSSVFTMQHGESQPTSWRKMMPLSPQLKNKPCMKPA